MLTIRNLVKTYGNGPRAVDDLTLSFEAGDIYGFIGYNGAGKTTALEPQGIPVFAVSAATTEGFGPMLDRIVQMLDALPPVRVYDETELLVGAQYEKGFTVHRDDAGTFVVEGGDVERILDTTDPEDDVSMRRFQQLLIKTGIISALREMGAKDGDTIRLGEWEFDFTD